MTDKSRKLKVAIVGALTACYFAKRGHEVRVYEYRADIRVEDSRGQSIDLALSTRGREALREVGLEDLLVNRHGIPMRGRMIHERDGTLREIIYDSVKKNCIYSVSRKYLNEVLLNAAETYPGLELHFNEKLVDVDLDRGKMKLLNTRTKVTSNVEADLIVGADGAYSTVRKSMIKRPLFDFSQTYIEHGYIEIYIPPSRDNDFAMSDGNLHIWPRGEFMMIALPNEDRSFTGNLFAPFETLRALDTPENLLNFYEDQFPDVLPLIGREKLVKDFFSSEPKTLISIKCKPYHVGKTALIIGDAAHAMVPFYAQGMNAGFEDVIILDKLMELYDSDLSKVLPAFSETRCQNAHAICDLAMYNYVEVFFQILRKIVSTTLCISDHLYFTCLTDERFGQEEIIHFEKVLRHGSLLALSKHVASFVQHCSFLQNDIPRLHREQSLAGQDHRSKSLVDWRRSPCNCFCFYKKMVFIKENLFRKTIFN
ncbi:kynurenine 3-monooxygenase isoform X2 [Cephus cinctus]|uniref:Kynurenine 3-monooxygenase isoform X2 n=1 Tax=Cephus cinctus TaxID=211228 RepID=A0AAJ7BMQ7_CEPCN|nr:kynurenine 3-monooxygenase isoform X2 [Cephus cinctus]